MSRTNDVRIYDGSPRGTRPKRDKCWKMWNKYVSKRMTYLSDGALYGCNDKESVVLLTHTRDRISGCKTYEQNLGKFFTLGPPFKGCVKEIQLRKRYEK